MGNTSMQRNKDARQRADDHMSKWRLADDMKWGYGRDRGPDTWWVYYPQARGQRQSPIDIDPEVADFDSDLASYPLRISYPVKGSKLMYNTGHGCQLHMQEQRNAFYVTGGPFERSRYRLHQFHFHWGDKDDCGSEHTVNQKAFSMEIHFVHWNTEKYNSFKEAAIAEDGLCVLAVFVRLDHSAGAGMQYLGQYIQHVLYKDQSVDIEAGFDIRLLLPGDCTKYWVYKGSLTTPPCSESVTWIVFYEPIAVSHTELGWFRNMRSHCEDQPRPPLDEFGGYILQNYRPVQDLGSRRITTMEHVFMSAAEFDEQFHKQSMFTRYPEYACQYHRQGLMD